MKNINNIIQAIKYKTKESISEYLYINNEISKYIIIFIIAFPFSIIFNNSKNFMISFIFVCLTIIPVAGIIGLLTENISNITNSIISALLNATMGNIPELIIGFYAVKAGLFSMVKAGVIGSITGNLLLVLGFSTFCGGIKYKIQTFDKMLARINFGLLFVTLIGFIIPTSFKYFSNNSQSILYLSFYISIILIFIYVLGLIFSLFSHKRIFFESNINYNTKNISLKRIIISIIILSFSIFIIAYEANILIKIVYYIKNIYNLSESFMGIILIPIIGNISEYSSAILMATKNKINVSLDIAISSCLQMALFVSPVLIISSFILNNPIDILFTYFDIIIITCSIGISLFIFQDGKTNWFEGVELICVYIIISIAYFFME